MIIFKLKKLMELHSIGQRELSRLTGIRQSTIGDYCNNKAKQISLDNLNKLCKHFNVSESSIIEYIEDEK